MSEKEMFINAWEREFGTTMKVLRAYPPERADLKPSEKSRPAKDLMWTFASEEALMEDILEGKIDFMNLPKAPATHAEMLSAYEALHRSLVPKVKAMPEADWNSMMPFMVAPKQMGQVRRGDLMWMMIMDHVHHRGQLSVYMRLAGAKVPSIYGPTADEPWM